jgi:ornithine cyclodeaminase/alanine dehydrogenase-like protein (mu-crystallin family)
MTLLLSRDDLRPLLTDSDLVRAGLEVIADSLTRPVGPAGPGDSSWWAFPLADGPTRLNVHAMTTSWDGTIVRCWPTDRPGALAHGLTLLFDRSEGALLAVLAGGEYLMWRTAGPVMLACRHLAPPAARTAALIGTGIQARYHLIGLRQALSELETIRVYSRDPAHRREFAAHAGAALGLEARVAESARAAVEGAEVVISTAGSREPVLEPAWVWPGALVADIYLGVPRAVGRLVTPTRNPPREVPSGREPHPEAAGHRELVPDLTLAEVIAGRAPARTRPDQTVLYVELGVFGWDTALTAHAYAWARRNGIGTSGDL